MARLDGRVAVVTGAGRGIGASVARALAAHGAAVVVNDLGVALDGTEPDGGPARQVVDGIAASGGTAVANGDDVADHAAAERLVRTAIERFGKLDVLVNVAVSLYSNPEPVRQIVSTGPWDLDKLANLVESTFRPVVEGSGGPWTPRPG
ncbi:MAG: SDR family NAD(P)-dependent oxidoreductase [Streptosporangiales bacterium]|nr:SDR family NAD(P)-dependent oxidoreductase [Streptosporangiales bacterium]